MTGIGTDTCHDACNRDYRMGPNSTYYVLGSLDEARSYFDRLPSDRKQNYELHLALDVVEQMVRTISAGVCTADQVNQ